MFGAALSQAGSFWWSSDGARPGYLSRLVASEPPVPLRVHLAVGRLETDDRDTLAANRALRDVLAVKGYATSYHETGGVHHHVCWQAGLASGLTALLPA